ncbi:TPA: hypothetical protein ACH3X3_011821, partial [Trebouxia sp. C0006]
MSRHILRAVASTSKQHVLMSWWTHLTWQWQASRTIVSIVADQQLISGCFVH